MDQSSDELPPSMTEEEITPILNRHYLEEHGFVSRIIARTQHDGQGSEEDRAFTQGTFNALVDVIVHVSAKSSALMEIAGCRRRALQERVDEISQGGNPTKLAELEARIAKLESQPRGLKYRGVWAEGELYDQGDAVTFDGSIFVTMHRTRERPAGSSDWRLAIKRGRDGKDLR